MLHTLERHHHFRLPLLRDEDYVARLEATVVQMLLESAVDDDHRDSSIAWELKHQAGVTQMARILAARRGLDPEVAAVGALLHDIYVIVTGSYENHARRGGPIAKDMLAAVGIHDRKILDPVLLMVTHHSDKDLFEDDQYAELGKDVDVLDCLLYPHAIAEYLLTKPLYKVKAYLGRAQEIWRELGIDVPPEFTILDDYQDASWLPRSCLLAPDDMAELESLCEKGTLPHVIAAAIGSGVIQVSTGERGMRWLTDVVQVAHQDLPLLANPPAEYFILWPGLRRKQQLDSAAYTQLLGMSEGSAK